MLPVVRALQAEPKVARIAQEPPVAGHHLCGVDRQCRRAHGSWSWSTMAGWRAHHAGRRRPFCRSPNWSRAAICCGWRVHRSGAAGRTWRRSAGSGAQPGRRPPGRGDQPQHDRRPRARRRRGGRHADAPGRRRRMGDDGARRRHLSLCRSAAGRLQRAASIPAAARSWGDCRWMGASEAQVEPGRGRLGLHARRCQTTCQRSAPLWSWPRQGHKGLRVQAHTAEWSSEPVP